MKLSLAVALLICAQFLTTRRIAALALLHLPSTIAHELSHWLTAFVFRCRPSGFTLIPKRLHGNTWQLGAVTFYPGMLSAGFVALAPLWVLGSTTYWILWLRPTTTDLRTELLAGLVGGITAWAAIPSSTDWFIALRYPVGTAMLFIIFSLVLA